MNTSTTERSSATMTNIDSAPKLFDSDVVYFEDLDIDDDTLPPAKDEDDDGHYPSCQYSHKDRDDKETGCSKRPEFYIKARSQFPGEERVSTFYYCPMHYASNIGYLAYATKGVAPDAEIAYYTDRGIIPLRYQIIDFGRMG